MRVECEACHAVTAARFAIRGGVVVATCEACKAEMSVEAAAEAEAGSPTPTPALGASIDDSCPKCGSARAGETACPSCGLSAERMAAFAAARDAEVPDRVRTAWQRANDDWAAAARHDAMFEATTATGAYAWAATRYREAQRLRGDDPTAARQLERLRRAVEASLFATATVRSERDAKPFRLVTVLVVVIALALAGLFYALMHHRGAEPPATMSATPHG